jgi:predicted enzyme related to lactoylglutathione lyase
MNRHESINYLELPSSNLDATKTFFSNVFGWTFVDYGEEYTAFKEKSME